MPAYISSFLATWTQSSGRISISPNVMAEGETQQPPSLPALRWDKRDNPRCGGEHQGQASALFLCRLLLPSAEQETQHMAGWQGQGGCRSQQDPSSDSSLLGPRIPSWATPHA